MKTRFLLLLTLPFALAACIETKNVNTFANSVSVVTSATDWMIQADRANCARINATLAELEAIRKKSVGSANCAQLDKVLDAIYAVNTVLGNYGRALGDVSQDTFVNYDSDVNGLRSLLQSLPGRQPTKEQIDAVSGLAGWVASLATQGKRDQAIKDAMIGRNGEMKENFRQAVALLRQLVSQYSEGLEAEANLTRLSLNLVWHDYGATEPVAVAEMRARVAAGTQASDDHKEAIRQYLAALDAMTAAFDAATREPSAKELLPQVRDFARQARTMQQAISKAFHMT